MNISGIILGIAICLGGIGSYLPQFYNIIKYKSVEGISEVSLIILNIGLMCLTMNSLIFSWDYFFCATFTTNMNSTLFENVHFENTADCFSNLLPFITILISWLMVLVYYIIFIIYKFKKYEKRIISGLNYCITYVLFTTLIISLAFAEKLNHATSFFEMYANVLGITSATANGLVYLPQIYTLYINKSPGNLSLLMYLIQTPGNIIIIIFQFLFSTKITTVLTYFIVLLEQSIILFQLLYYRYQRDLYNSEYDSESENLNTNNIVTNDINSIISDYFQNSEEEPEENV
jgi:uncharacterized protein with PQ loop repeat